MKFSYIDLVGGGYHVRATMGEITPIYVDTAAKAEALIGHLEKAFTSYNKNIVRPIERERDDLLMQCKTTGENLVKTFNAYSKD